MSKQSRNKEKLDEVFHVKPDTRSTAEKIADAIAKREAAQRIGKKKQGK